MNHALLRYLKHAVGSLGETAHEIATGLIELNIKGKLRTSDSCPIACYLVGKLGDNFRVEVTSDYVALYSEDQSGGLQFQGGFPLPLPVSDFVIKFDTGEYPDLMQ